MKPKVVLAVFACLVPTAACSSSTASPSTVQPTATAVSPTPVTGQPTATAVATSQPTAVACAAETGSGDLLFGAALPLSGVIAASGRQIQTALNSSASYINSHGGVCGRNIKWEFQDNGYPSGTQAAVAVRTLVGDNVLAVLNFGTPGVAATYQYLVSNNVMDLVLFAGLSAFEPLAPTAMSVYSDYKAQGEALGQYVAQTYPNQAVAVLYQDNDLGQSYLAGFSQYVKNIPSPQKYSATDVDFSTQLNAMKATGAQVAACFCLTSQVSQMLKFRQSSGWNPPVVTESSNAGTSLVTTVGASLTDNVVSMDFFPPTSGPDATPAMAQLAQEITSTDSTIPLTPYTIVSGALNNVLADAVGLVSGDVTRQSLTTALHQTQVQGAWYGSTVSLPTGRAPALFTCWRMTVINAGTPTPNGSPTCESQLSGS